MTTYLPIGHPSPNPVRPTVGNRTPVSLVRDLSSGRRNMGQIQRIVIAALVAAVVLSALGGFRTVQRRGLSESVTAPYERMAATQAEPVNLAAGEWTMTIVPGDTLWAIAVALAPGQDPRPVVDALADRNGGSALLAGDTLVVPAGLGQKMEP